MTSSETLLDDRRLYDPRYNEQARLVPREGPRLSIFRATKTSFHAHTLAFHKPVLTLGKKSVKKPLQRSAAGAYRWVQGWIAKTAGWVRSRCPEAGQGEVSSLSVIIPALNEERHVGALLSDIAAQTRKPDEVLVVDAGSTDGTVPVVRRSAFAELLEGTPPVACGRNLGGRRATGDVLIFLDADVRLSGDFLEDFLGEFENRGLDVACPLYVPYRSTPAIEAFHGVFNLVTRVFQGTLPSGAGHCIAVKRSVFQESRGFDPGLKFDDIELIRRLSKGRRFGIVGERVFVSDRRYRKQGTPRMILRYLLMALFFALGKFSWANHIGYEFGGHDH
jgi:Glycosyl transferase family 2